MQNRATVTVYGPGILARQRKDITRLARSLIQPDVGEPLPSAPDADHFTTVFGSPVSYFLDDGIETWDIAASGENADTLIRHGPFYIRAGTSLTPELE
jgi:hypothetical protein